MSGKKCKIALCLSGEPRSSMFCFPYYYETFLNNNPMYETDVYIHTWKNFRALPLYNPKKFTIDIIDQNQYLNNFFNKNGLNNLLTVKKDLAFFGNLTKHSVKIYNTLLMHTSIKRCFDLIDQSYDIIVRGRFDLFFSTKLDIIPYILDLIKYQTSDIILPFTKYNLPQNTLPYISDQFAIGTPKAMKIYSNLIDNIVSVIESTESIIPEVLLSQHLRNNNLRVKDVILSPELIRGVNPILHKPSIFNSFLDE
jgi:hypothetical protein